MTFTVATAQYPIDALADWDAYAAKIWRWVADAATGGAQLAVFPEYGAMELASLDPDRMGDLAGSLAVVADLLPRVDALHAELARHHDMHLLAASAPCRREDGRYVNRARLFAPSGAIGWQDKLVMTRFEREEWGVVAGDALTLFDTDLGRIGIVTCYDSEFPLIARALVEAGADILLVPSCTDSLQGHARVRIGAQARALENQCFAIHSCTVGTAPWSPAVDINRGAAAVYGPPDGAIAVDGILAAGALDAAQWVFCDIDRREISEIRANGAVLNFRDWANQWGSFALPAPQIVRMQGQEAGVPQVKA